MKKCSKCGIVKPIDQFPSRHGRRYAGKEKAETHCRACETKRKASLPGRKAQMQRINAQSDQLAKKRMTAKERKKLYEDGKIQPPDWRRCTRCGITKDSGSFNWTFSNPSCLDAYCRDCRIDYRRSLNVHGERRKAVSDA